MCTYSMAIVGIQGYFLEAQRSIFICEEEEPDHQMQPEEGDMSDTSVDITTRQSDEEMEQPEKRCDGKNCGKSVDENEQPVLSKGNAAI